ncbi:uncharacterized protein LOC104912506 [Meleagris gallopavo]|uniref:uncharacterized protein LOC104912506 n=1 Tax=Meleagris gallopavo TaxID=9103 RepID=UPI000549DA45|nr:uncharacterized protein LOC104912506 [Meleagris gallopavo]
MNFLKEKKEKALSHQDHYKILQEKHKQELEEMRKAGHEALSIIVEEFKSLLQCTVQQQEAATEKQYILAIEKHSYKCQELLNAQESRKTTGPLYLYLNLHQTIFIWNHCLENFFQGGKCNLFLNAFCFKLLLCFKLLSLLLSGEWGRSDSTCISPVWNITFQKDMSFLLLENTVICFMGLLVPLQFYSSEFSHISILHSAFSNSPTKE